MSDSGESDCSSPQEPSRQTATRQDLVESELQGGDGFVLRDRFGFFLTDEFHQEASLSPEEAQKRKEKEAERTRKWVRMIKKWNRHFPQDSGKHSFSTNFTVSFTKQSASKNLVSSSKLHERVRKGIPDAVRGFAWHSFACYAQPLPANTTAVQSIDSDESSPTTRTTHIPNIPDPNQLDVSRLNETTREEIERDIDRTFPRHVMFVENDGDGQASLRRLLQWYACVDEEVGYCQGMGFIAGLFLTYMTEEEAWETFYAVLQRPSSPLRLLYLPRLSETQKLLFVFERLCNEYLPTLWKHLSAEGMHPTMFFTEWVMCIYCRGFSFELVTRVWDVFLHEGDMKIVYRVALAILKCFEEELMSLKFEKIMNFMRQIANSVDAQTVMNIAWQIPLRRAVIEKFEHMYDGGGSKP